jgi:cullin 4
MLNKGTVKLHHRASSTAWRVHASASLLHYSVLHFSSNIIAVSLVDIVYKLSPSMQDVSSSGNDRKRKLNTRRPSTSESKSANPNTSYIDPNIYQAETKIPNNSVSSSLSPKNKRPRTDFGPRPHSPIEDLAPPLKPTTSDKMYTNWPTKSRAHQGGAVSKATEKSTRKNGLMNNDVRNLSMNPYLGPKKLVVKNLRPQAPFDSKNYLDEKWAQLENALDVLFASGIPTFPLDEMYRAVENCCKYGEAEELSKRLNKKMTKHLLATVREPLLCQLSTGSVDLLKASLIEWNKWNALQEKINWMFCFLDRSYLLSQDKSLQEIATTLFYKATVGQEDIRKHILDGACEMIMSDRSGNGNEEAILKDAICMFHAIGAYRRHFEPQFLSQAQSYVVEFSGHEVVNSSLAGYVKKATDLIGKEIVRCGRFGLDNSTTRELVTLLDNYLVSEQEKRLTDKDAVADLLDDNLVVDLKRLYTFLERRQLGTRLRPAFESWIELTGTTIIFDERAVDSMVVKLLCLKNQLDRIWQEAFERNEDLGHGLRESFETFINKTKKTSATYGTDNSKPAEMIAKYVDLLLRGGAKVIPAEISKTAVQTQSNPEEDNEEPEIDEDTEVNNQLDQVLDLFRFVHGKAVFEAFYKKDLARRLLMGRSASADAERSMLTRLKTGK